MLSVHSSRHCTHRATQLMAIACSPSIPRHRRRRPSGSWQKKSSLASASAQFYPKALGDRGYILLPKSQEQNSRRLPPPAPPPNRTRHPSHHRPQALAT